MENKIRPNGETFHSNGQSGVSSEANSQIPALQESRINWEAPTVLNRPATDTVGGVSSGNVMPSNNNQNS